MAYSKLCKSPLVQKQVDTNFLIGTIAGIYKIMKKVLEQDDKFLHFNHQVTLQAWEN